MGRFQRLLLRKPAWMYPSFLLLPIETREPYDSARVRFVHSWGVELSPTGLMDLIEWLHGCMLSCANSDVNMRTWKPA